MDRHDKANVNQFFFIVFSTALPEMQNESPEQLPFSNICIGRIILILKVFNLPCQTHHNGILQHLPTLQKKYKYLAI